MKKILVTLLAAGTLSFAAMAPAAAQGVETGLVKIPFQFIVGDKVMPAGSYWISRQTADWSVVSIENQHSGALVFASTSPVPNAEPSSNKVRVLFSVYYGQHFLQQVTLPGRDGRSIGITKTQAEQTLAKLNLMPAESAAHAK